MIDDVFFREIGLTGDQIALLRERLDHISRYRQTLLQEGVNPKCVEKIVRATKPEEIDFNNEDLLREKVRVEWADFMIRQTR